MNGNDRKSQAATSLGIDADNATSVRSQLSILRQQGVLIDLDIRGVGMFTRTASWAEIGIQDDVLDPRISRITRGQKFLIDEEDVKQLRSVESRMRQLIDQLGRDVTGFRPFRWLPFTAHREFRARWLPLLDTFNEIKQTIIVNHPAYIETIRSGYEEVAEASWKSIVAQGYNYAIIDGRDYDREKFVQMIADHAVTQIPTIQRIEDELIADYHVALVYGEEDVAADELAAETLRAQIRQQREGALAATLEQQHQNRMNVIEEDARKLQIQAMIEIEADHARDQLQSIASPFEEVFVSLRRQISEDAKSILDSIKKNGFVRGKVASKGAGLVELFDLLATHDDREMRQRLIELKNAIGPIGHDRQGDTPERSTNEVAGILEEIIQLQHTAVKDLLSGPSRFSMVEI